MWHRRALIAPRNLSQQCLDLWLPNNLALFSKDRGEDFVGSEWVGEDNAQNGELLGIVCYAKPGPGDEGLARFPLVFLQQLADLVEDGIDG
jgi:hypothetical protein